MAEKNSAQSIFVWLMLLLVIIGLGGFGIDGILSQRATAIGSVGGREISTQTYARALQSEMRAFQQQIGEPVSMAQAQAFGLDARARSQLITQAALENEAERVGISVGDDNVQRTVTSIGAFQGPTGQFDMTAYRFALENAGQTPSEFEEEVRRDSARGILQAATAAGTDTPAAMRTALVEYYATRHNFELYQIGEGQLPAPVADPTEEQVEAFYTANIAQFTAPEMRRISYVWLTPEMILEEIDVDEDSIRRLYDERIDAFQQPERRLVERLVFPDDAAAAEASARLAAGDVTFDALVEERGLTLDDVDLGDVRESQLGAAGAEVFALAEPGDVTAPLPTDLARPALFRMNAILDAQETSFEDARQDLRDELALDAARRSVADRHEGLDDLLAGGASIEDMASETSMVAGQIDWSRDVNDGIAGYTEFASAAAAVTADDFPELMGLSDGGVFALRLDEIIPPAPIPLDEVREAASAGARDELVNAALLAYGQTLSAELASGGAESFSEAHNLAPERFEAVTRLDRLAQVPFSMLEELMTGEVGAPILHVEGGIALLALVEDSEAPDLEDEQTESLINAIDEQIGQALSQDVFGYFANALRGEAGIELNQAAINAVHANFH